MTKEQGSLVKVGDILFHTIYEKNIVVTHIITVDDKRNGWIGDFQYRFENKTEPNDTENWYYVNFIRNK